jgi:putative phage-type endonuclease
METVNVVQKSQDWLTLRRGKFTASEIYKLIGTGQKPSKFGDKLDDWTDTAATYIKQKVAECFSDQSQELKTRATDWGIEHEPEARAYYEGVFGEEVEDIGFILWPKDPTCGCSPDGIVKGKNRGIEIKTPFELEPHLESFLIRSNDEFKAMKPQYYWQVMASMMFSGLPCWDFVSYHPFFYPNRRISSIEIIADPVAFAILEDRLTAAVFVRNELIKQVNL